MRTRRLFSVPLIAALLMPSIAARVQPPVEGGSGPVLKPTNHPRVPGQLSLLWLAPDKARAPRTAVQNDFTTAVKLEVDGNFAKALPILAQPSIQQGILGHYAEYYQGLAELRLGRPADAREIFQRLRARNPPGYLVEAAAMREADCDEALGDAAAAMEIYDRLAKAKTTAPDDVLMRLGRSARAAGNTDITASASRRD